MKYLILLSGGLDSAALLYYRVKHCAGSVAALFFRYGQKSTERESEAVKYLTKEKSVQLIELELHSVFCFSKSALLTHNAEPVAETIRTGRHTEYRSKGTEVEFRNGVLLSAAVSYAMQAYPGETVSVEYGAIRTREPFPDCSAEFVEHMDAAARLCTDGKVGVTAPFIDMGKDEVMVLARELGVPTGMTWSCYEGGDVPCGKCPACIDRRILEGEIC